MNTAAVQAGLVVRVLRLAGATMKVHLTPNGSVEGSLWCHECRWDFGPMGPVDLNHYRSPGG